MTGVEGGAKPTGESGQALVPYVSADRSLPELTVRALALGVVLAVVFGAANAYVGLKTGLTVTASIPAAVISMAVLRGVLKRSNILENNMVQTVGSTGESLAAGVIFTIPALIFLGLDPSKYKIFMLSVAGGLLGILFMIPLRHYLMVREHGVLPFPEGTACANVLVAGEEGGVKARHVFRGLALGGLYRFFMSGLALWRDMPFWSWSRLHKAGIGFELTPILLGVGYLIGPRIAATMLAGGLMAWLVLLPLVDFLGHGLSSPLYPAPVPIADLSADDIWNYYIRYIGAGGVAVGGAISLLRALPTIGSSAKHSLRAFVQARKGEGAETRTTRDMPLPVVIAGSVVVVVALAVMPVFGVGWLGAVIAVVFSFFFVAVSSRMVGLIGTTSQPVSGMTITALLITGVIFAALGRTDAGGMAAAIVVGSIVCIAICLSGDIAQDLKTGALVGATPFRQQYSEVVGMLASALFSGWVLYLLHQAYGLGSKHLSAPQARLMADLIRGVMGGDLPWTLLLLGVGIGLVVELVGVSALPFAIGLYLPVTTSAPVIFGGLLALALERRAPQGAKAEMKQRGMLFGSGLIAGDALMGILIAALSVVTIGAVTGEPLSLADRLALRDPSAGGAWEDVLSFVVFGLLVLVFWRTIFGKRAHGRPSGRVTE